MSTPAPSDVPAGRILVVDDIEDNRDLLARRLTRQGHLITLANGGIRALELALSQDFDLVLLDIMMPDLDGYEVLRQLKEQERTRHVPVVMISALTEMDSIVKCVQMGADDYLTKPFNPTLLRARVNACLEKKRLRDGEQVAHAALQDSFRKLQELEKLRDDLTHMIVHDLRTPLTSLLAGLQTIEAIAELDAVGQECLGMSVHGGQTLLGMVNDLLDISKMESGTLTLERQTVVASDLVSQALQQVSWLAQENQLCLVPDVAEGLPPFSGDEDKLRRTLVNLLGNALKFTPEGGAVTLSAAQPGTGMVRFSVSDTGMGIPQEAFDKIFEKFGQVESRQAKKMSTGLGLTFCKMVAEAHGGRIWVESVLGQGSTFSVEIPLS